MKPLNLRRSIQVGTAVLLLATAALPFQMDQQFSQAQQQNAMALRQYAWKSRTEIQRGGETKNVQLAYMRYDINGSVQKTPISSTPQAQLPTRGIRGLIAQKKMENFMGTMEGLGALAKSYADLPPSAMQRFMASAMVAPEMGQQQKLFRITGTGLLQPGDSMTIWIDAVTRKQRRVEIHTSLERKPVTIVSDFQDLQAGPTYVARSIIEYPTEELRVFTENFEYQRVAR